jgi:hypothetical protein
MFPMPTFPSKIQSHSAEKPAINVSKHFPYGTAVNIPETTLTKDKPPPIGTGDNIQLLRRQESVGAK